MQVLHFTPRDNDLGIRLYEDDIFVVCDASDSAFGVTLPDAEEAQTKRFTFYKTDSSSNAVTLTASGQYITSFVAGVATEAEAAVIDAQYEALTLVSDGTKWRAVLTEEVNTGKSHTYYLSNFANLAAAIAEIGATVCDLVIDTTETLTANHTIAATTNVMWANNGLLTVNSTYTLTINRMDPGAPLRQLFAGAGSVLFGVGATDRLLTQWWGAVGDGSTDCTSAFQSAATASQGTTGPKKIFLPRGKYRITDTITFHMGAVLEGEGPQGSNIAYATSISYEPSGNDKPCLLWDGGGSAGYTPTNAGTGGGASNLFIAKNNAATGCDGIKLLAIDDSHRPGEMLFRNILIAQHDSTAYNWAKGFHIDGTACTTAGSKGIRSVRLEKVRAATCSEDNKYIHVNQGVHVTSDHLQIDTGSGTGTCGMTVEGDSDNIILSGMVLNGNLVIGGSSTMNICLSGRVSAVDINNTSALGVVNVQSTAVTNASEYVRVNSDVADAFLAYTTATLANVTGDGTSYVFIPDTEVYDKATSYDVSTGTFTAKSAGMYAFGYVVLLYDLLQTHSRFDITIDHKRSGSTINSFGNVQNPYPVSVGSTPACSVSGAVNVNLQEGDTVVLTINVSGGTKTVDIYGTAGTRYSYWYGKLLV